MAILYIDKFRGFSNTIIPFADVNFMVGENSTGKSSIMALIHLLCSPSFWFSQNFNLPEFEFGGFRDILSSGCSRHENFTFGLSMGPKHVKSKDNKYYSYIISYKEKDALPCVSLFARLDGVNLLALRQFRNGYRYRNVTLSQQELTKNQSDVFALLTSQDSLSEDQFRDLPEDMPTRTDFFSVLTMLENIAKWGKNEEREVIFQLPLPLFTHNIAWLAPIRTKPKRTYDSYGKLYSPEGEHTPYLLRKRLDSHSGARAFRAALDSFGKESGLFSKVAVHKLGNDAAAPFELMVDLGDRFGLRINSVGYGVSQALPLVVEMLVRERGAWFAIQQPEIHLHPRAQAALGDLIYQMAEAEKKRFFVETHSDFTIDRFRMNLRRQPEHKSTAQFLYFERSKTGNVAHVIPIDKHGDISNKQPHGFRNFFVKEQMNLLGL